MGPRQRVSLLPLVTHSELGLTLHPFDLATNKVLALVGRREPRDWVDAIERSERLQPLGFLAWAACGKDPGFSPSGIIEHAARHHYSALEVGALSFAGPSPEVAALSRKWRQILDDARATVDLLPPEKCGHCVLDKSHSLLRGTAADVERALRDSSLSFLAGTIGGALPEVVG